MENNKSKDNLFSEDRQSNGVLYLAFGYEYLIQAINSLRSLRENHPNIPVKLLTNLPVNRSLKAGPFESCSFFDDIEIIDDENKNNRRYKTSLYDYSPYDRTLYLDVDTIVQDEITTGFRYLDAFDVALKPILIPIDHVYEYGDPHIPGLQGNEFAQWNAGVMFFKNNKDSEQLFQLWNKKYKEFNYGMDQFSLSNSIYNSDIRTYPLSLPWNAGGKTLDNPSISEDDVKIYHYQIHGEYEIVKTLLQLEQEIGDEVLKVEDTSQYRDEFKQKYRPLKREYKIESIKNEILDTFPFSIILGNRIIKHSLKKPYKYLIKS